MEFKSVAWMVSSTLPTNKQLVKAENLKPTCAQPKSDWVEPESTKVGCFDSTRFPLRSWICNFCPPTQLPLLLLQTDATCGMKKVVSPGGVKLHTLYIGSGFCCTEDRHVEWKIHYLGEKKSRRDVDFRQQYSCEISEIEVNGGKRDDFGIKITTNRHGTTPFLLLQYST